MLEKAFQNCFKPPQVNLSGIWESTPRLRIRSHQHQKRVPAIEKRIIEESPETRLLCPESEAYPLQLKEIDSPPSMLYWKGIEGLSGKPCLAFVGSRACSAYGLKHTKRLILELAEAQPELVIFSGMARESIPLPIKSHLMQD